MNTEVLAPLAVISMENTENNAMACLNQYAGASNSNLVYAHDEFGNDVAVGLFVTNEFFPNTIENEHVKVEKCLPDELKEPPNITWVAAVEECESEIMADTSLKENPDMQSDKNIRIYQVTKKSKKTQDRCLKSRNAQKTLNQLKKSKLCLLKGNCVWITKS